jgi:hypothetical protein
LCLCTDNESSKQSPESIRAPGINSNGDDDESVCHSLDPSLLRYSSSLELPV